MPNVTISAPQPLTFKAVWTDQNKHLDDSFINKITRYAFFILNKIAVALIVPSVSKTKNDIKQIDKNFQRKWTNPISNEEKLIKNNFTPNPIKVTTPDGVGIEGTFFKNAAATHTSPTVIFFQPNAMHSKQGVFDWVIKEAALRNIPYNFVYFDHRGCDGTRNLPKNAKDLYLDGESIYQFVKNELKVPAKDIHFYGYSLGAGIASTIKAMNPEATGNYVNDRSFTTINDTLKNMISRPLAFLAGLFTSLLNWNIDTAKAMDKLKGKTLIVHHPEDELMKGEASLYRHIFQRATGGVPSPDISHLDLSRSKGNHCFIHGTPLENFSTNQFNPQDEIVRFLFNTKTTQTQRMVELFRNGSADLRGRVYTIVAQEFQGGGYYYGSGEDACLGRNNLSITDSQLAEAVMIAKLSNR